MKKLGTYSYERWLCVSALGGKCQRCGNGERDVLQCDHINGDGFLTSRKGGPTRSSSKSRGSSAKDFRTARVSGRLHEIYQLLCANCHSKKTKENGEFKRRDITNIETPSLPLLEWGKIPSFVEQRMDSE